MRKGFLASTLAALLGGGVAWSQTDGPVPAAATAEAADGWTAHQAVDPKAPPPGPVAADPLKLPPTNPACPTPGPTVCPDPGRCGPPYRYWASAEYLLWWTKKDSYPPLVTTATPPGLGALGAPGTLVLFGGDVDYGVQQGVRLTAGMWLDECNTKGVEFSTFTLCSESDDFA